MDLKALASFKTQTAQVGADRHTIAEQACQKGVEILQRIYHQGPVDKQLMKEAHSAFIKAIQYNRKALAPYLGISYLLVFIGDRAMARKYIQEALRLDPQNEEVTQLLKYITERESGKLPTPASPGETQAPGPAEPDIDALYEQLAFFISKHAFKASSTIRKWKPTAHERTLQEMNALLDTLQAAYQSIQQRMEALEQELDTHDLRTELVPLESSLNTLQNLLRVSRTLRDIGEQIQQANQQIRQQLQELKAKINEADLNTCETYLEGLMDHCDLIADQLDDLEKAGHSIEELESPYQSLLGLVENFRDVLDDIK